MPRTVDPTVSEGLAARRLALGCAAGLAIGTAASWARFLVEGTLVLDTGSRVWIASAFLLGVGLAVAGACALLLARIAPAAGPRALLKDAILVHLCAAP